MKIQVEIVPISEVPDAEELGVKPVILVVDDDAIVADTLSLILRHAGYSTLTAYAPLRALEIVEAKRPALLLSDIAMPDMNGVALAIAVRAMHPECGVLLISGHATSRDLVAANDSGYNFTLLQKPVHPTEVLRHIAMQLNGHPTIKAVPPPARKATSFSVEVA